MSQTRQRLRLSVEQEPFLTVRSLPATFSSAHVIEWHSHSWRQFLFALSGAMTVQAGRSSWMIPPGKAVFIPAGCAHSIRMWGEVAMRSLYFPPDLDAPALCFETCRVVSVTPLMRELILKVVGMVALDGRVPEHNRLLGVLLDEMNTPPETPLELPLPLDARAVSVAHQVLADPAGTQTIEEISRECGAARRTVERLFRGETGMSFGLWRQKVRLLNSIRLLAEGKPVIEAAFDSGYMSVSAFISAFRRTFGVTPGRL